MPFVPDSPRRGQDILDWARQVSAFLRATYPRGGSSRTNATGSSALALARRAGASSTPQPKPVYRPFELVRAVSEGAHPAPRVRVVASWVDGDFPTGFSPGDDPPYLLTPKSGLNEVFFVITINEDGEVDSVTLDHDSEIPDSDDTTKYVRLGYYKFESPEGGGAETITSIGNYAFGPASISLCPTWLSSPQTYNFSMIFGGGTVG